MRRLALLLLVLVPVAAGAQVYPGPTNLPNLTLNGPATGSGYLLWARSGGATRFTLDGNGNLGAAGSLVAGVLRSNGNAIINGGWVYTESNGFMGVQGGALDGAAAVGVVLNNSNALSTAGAKLLSIRNNGVEKAWTAYDGTQAAPGFISSSGWFQTGTNAVGMYLRAGVADGAAAVGTTLDTTNAFATAGAKLLSARTAGTEKANIDKDGQIQIGIGNASALPTCAAGIRGTVGYVGGGAGTKDTVAVCAKDAANAYAWRTIY